MPQTNQPAFVEESDWLVSCLRRHIEVACLQECRLISVAKATSHRADCAEHELCPELPCDHQGEVLYKVC